MRGNLTVPEDPAVNSSSLKKVANANGFLVIDGGRLQQNAVEDNERTANTQRRPLKL